MVNDASTLKTTARSLGIIDIIDSQDGVRTEELIRELDISKSSIHNHLATLRENEFIVKEGDRYHLGMKLYHLGERAKMRRLSYEVIGEAAIRMANELDMVVDFNVEEYGRIIVIFNEVGSANRNGYHLGRYIPIHACAAGKAILAEYSRERIESIINRRGLPQLTENTITDEEELFAEIEVIRERGYAVNDEESDSGIQAISTAIEDPGGTIVGGLSIAGPTYNYPAYEVVSETLLSSSEDLEQEISKRWDRKFHPNN